MPTDAEIEDALHAVITEHERWTFDSVRSSPHDDEFIADLVAAVRRLLGPPPVVARGPRIIPVKPHYGH
jgi:hypothetical protein